MPGLSVVRTYQAAWVRHDVVAGLVLTALLVPQGMAYAELAGVPPVTGLYTTILCLLGYAVFGPSRILVLGPDSSLGPMIAAAITPLVATGGPARATALASALGLMVGIIISLAGVIRLGFVADLLSKPTMIGYMNGLALTIVVGQLPKLFGFSVNAEGLIQEIRRWVTGVADGETVAAALAIGAFGLAVILTLQRIVPKVPAVLVAVVTAILAEQLLHLSRHGVDVVGTLPQGFPSLRIPDISGSDITKLFGGALGISLIALADTISTASSFAARSGAEVDGSREMVGIGAANLAAGFFQGFPVSTSGSRTAVAEQSGAKTQFAGVVGAVTITVMLLFVPGLLRNLPQPTLAAVVIAAALSLTDVRGTALLWRQRRSEALLSLAAFSGVAVLGVLPGIVVAVVLSVGNIFRHLWWPYQAILGRVPDLAGYHDVSLHPEAELIPGCVIFRFDAPLFFANARAFRERVRSLTDIEPPPQRLVVASEPITDIDSTAADMLGALYERLSRRGITLVFAEMKDPVRAKLRRYGLEATIDSSHFYPTVEEAVAATGRLFG